MVRDVAILAGLLVACGSGCVVLPYASPPIKATVAGGITIGPAETPGATHGPHPALTFRAGVHPQQLIGNPLQRRFDVGAGYLLEAPFSEPAPVRHGAYLEAAYRLWAYSLSKTSQLRLLVAADADLLTTDELGSDRVGGGGALGLHLELAGLTSEPFTSLDDGDEPRPPDHPDPTHPFTTLDDPEEEEIEEGEVDVIGYAFGEGSVGLYVSASYRHIDEVADYWVLHGGLSFRLPASIGILIYWF